MTDFPNHILMNTFDREIAGNVVVARVSPKMLTVLKSTEDDHCLFGTTVEDAHQRRCWGSDEQIGEIGGKS